MNAQTPAVLAAVMRSAQAAYDNAAPAEPDEFTSSQPLGDTSVLVAFAVNSGAVCIQGAWINAEWCDENEFSASRREKWRAACQREFDNDRASACECAAERMEIAA